MAFCIQIMDQKCKIAYTIIQIESGTKIYVILYNFMKILKFKVYYKTRTNAMPCFGLKFKKYQTNKFYRYHHIIL